jgi:hypothetical protein
MSFYRSLLPWLIRPSSSHPLLVARTCPNGPPKGRCWAVPSRIKEARSRGYEFLLAVVVTVAVYLISRKPRTVTAADQPFIPTWKSLRSNRTPQWL